MIRKYHLKFLFFVFLVLFTISYVYYRISSVHDNVIEPDRSVQCRIYDQLSKCLISDGNIYLPASKIALIYDVHGFFDKNTKTYYLSHNDINYNNSNSYLYNPHGKYLFFEKYNVELRSKVKIISIDEGVPISIQWDKNGYKYPIQIAQFGLSHYSKWFELKGQQKIGKPFNLLDITNKMAPWISKVSSNKNVKFNSDSMSFYSTETITNDVLQSLPSFLHNGNQAHMTAILMAINQMPMIDDIMLPEVLIVGNDWKSGSAVHVKMTNNELGDFHLVYVCQSVDEFQPPTNVFVYSIKDCTRIKFIRHLYHDIIKLMPPKVVAENITLTTLLKTSVIEGITLFGEGSISRFEIFNQFSYEKFLLASDWFVNNQDKNGGWPTNVVRRIYANVKLDPGWYSAMAQGHALSLLTRAFHTTRNTKYIEAASKALNLFEVDSNNHGIRTYFLGQKNLVWYEEYPTKPSLFVLNGFMYSLFGLLDYKQSNGPMAKKANDLFLSGIESLQTLLPLFDSGFGSFYDLRHVTFPIDSVRIHKKQVRPLEVHDGPNRARWEYHVVHIEQLLHLGHSLEPNNHIFIDTAQRFLSYLKGHRSSHN